MGAKLALLGASLATVAAVALTVAKDEGPQPAVRYEAAAEADPDRELLAELRGRRDALRAQGAARPECVVDGTVTDLLGGAVPNAIVALAGNSVQAGALTQQSVRSDARGRWRSDPPEGAEFRISVTAPGYLAASVVGHCDADGGFDVVLAPGGTRLRGTVEDSGGGPIEGASLWVLPTTGDPNAAVSTTTGEGGTYDISVLADRYALFASHPDYVLSARQSVVASDEATEHFVLLPGASVEGVVFDTATRRPVEGARVATVWSVQDALRSKAPTATVFASFLPAVSDSEGRYRINGLPPGPVYVTARTPNLVNTHPAELSLTIAETKNNVDVEVSGARTVFGFLVDDDGSEDVMAGLHVVLLPQGGARLSSAATASAITDACGFYEIAGVQAGNYALLIAGRGAAPQVVNESVIVADEDVGELLSRVDSGVSVGGHVESVGRVSIHLEPAEPGASPRDIAVLALTRPEVDASGAFHFPSVAAGDYVVVATTLEGEGRASLTVRTDPVSDLSIAIDPLGRLEGELTGPTGVPVVGALVVAQPTGVPANSMITSRVAGLDHTDAQGRFALVGLKGGDYDVTVFDSAGQRAWVDEDTKRFFEARSIEVPATGAARLDLQVQTESAQIRGRVVGPDGEPVDDAWVGVRAQGSANAPFGYEPRPILTDSDGQFEVEGLFGGDFEVRVNGPGGNLETNATLSSQDAPANLVLTSVSTLVASVTENGMPAEGFELDVSGGPTRVLGSLVEKTNGTFTLPRLQSGEYQVTVTTKTAYAEVAVTLGPDPETVVEVELRARGSVHGLALDADGTPLPGGKVMKLSLI
ncbi:MAG: carboxypeptidase-like regulatory domain-containing protein, partial [Nannocystaceae bacterium]|nr:carboxypeptidase-like regulatory domain-containing protein [Nannocystaceae bacterium]